MEPSGKFTRVNPSSPEAFGICDLCGLRFNHVDLRWNYQWAGTRLYNTGSLRCWRCVDVPQEQLRSIILPSDPVPILNARVENFAYEEQTPRITQYAGSGEPPYGAGPAMIRCLQNGTIPRILQYSTSS